MIKIGFMFKLSNKIIKREVEEEEVPSLKAFMQGLRQSSKAAQLVSKAQVDLSNSRSRCLHHSSVSLTYWTTSSIAPRSRKEARAKVMVYQ